MQVPVEETSEAYFEFARGINIGGTFYCTQLVLLGMMVRRAGRIVNIASNPWASDPMHAHYAGVKAAVVSFTRPCAIHSDFTDQRQCGVAGGTRTNAELTAGSRAGVRGRYERGGALGRMNEATDIADAVLYRTSDEARNLSGHLLPVCYGSQSAAVADAVKILIPANAGMRIFTDRIQLLQWE